jgi:hypothetical protein
MLLAAVCVRACVCVCVCVCVCADPMEKPDVPMVPLHDKMEAMLKL